MCGIAGILSRDCPTTELRPRAERMGRAVAHRGPDDRGLWTSPSGRATFAHTRLAIIDPTPAGRQPMSIDNGRLTIVLNGEIYNFKELRRDLERKGVIFRTETDTEVVLRTYDIFGEAGVERLRGMFAFALWDERSHHCVLARDPFGIKPLYIAERGGLLVFASEVRALLASGLIEPHLDPQAVYEYFLAGSVQEPRTLVAGIHTLEAGHIAIWSDDSLCSRKYWEFSFAADQFVVDAPAATRSALLDSVQHHFVSDVPVGIFLSGGLDSTALLALAKCSGYTNVRALTMALPGCTEDESDLARRTARHFGVPHEVRAVDAETGKSLFGDYLRDMDQPSIDGMNTLAVAQLAQSCGMKAMLSGIGADELFGGYPSIHRVPQLAAWNRRLASIGVARPLAGLLQRSSDPRWRRVGDMLGQPPDLRTSYDTFRGVFTRAEARSLTYHYTGLQPSASERNREDRVDSDPTFRDGVCRLEMTKYLRNQLLRDADVMSMACGVELRLPFVDTVVVDTVTSLDPRDRLSPDKALLMKTVPEIPAWVVRQPKRGFMFPMEEWLNGSWNATFHDVEAASPVPLETWYRKWCLRAFEEWASRFDNASDVATAHESRIVTGVEIG